MLFAATTGFTHIRLAVDHPGLLNKKILYVSPTSEVPYANYSKDKSYPLAVKKTPADFPVIGKYSKSESSSHALISALMS